MEKSVFSLLLSKIKNWRNETISFQITKEQKVKTNLKSRLKMKIRMTYCCQTRGWQTFSTKDQRVNILGTAGLYGFDSTIQFAAVAIETRQWMSGYVPIKLQ